MTFVAAKRFGNRVIMWADTMISHEDTTQQSVIPGRLKAVIVNPTTTIAFSGLVDQATDAIRGVRHKLEAGASIFEIEHELADTTKRYMGHGDGIDFLVVSHNNELTLKRIWDGQISKSLDQVSIGQDLLGTLLENQNLAPALIVPDEFEEEYYFAHGFTQLFNGILIMEGVGGFGTQVICSPYGHTYGSWAGATSWDVIAGGQPVTQQQLDDRRSGKTQWGYNIQAPKLRGVGVIGSIVLNAGIGYIYAPVLQDKPIEWRFKRPSAQEQEGPILEEFQRRVDEVCERVGGGIDPDLPPDIHRAPTKEELEEILRYASSRPFQTSITVEQGAYIISCQTDSAGHSVRADSARLGGDPVWTLRTAIDRINNEVARRIGQPITQS